MQQSNIKTGAVDMTPSIVGFLYGLQPRDLFLTAFKELVRRRDIDSLETILSHPDVIAKPWNNIVFDLLSFRNDKDVRAARLFDKWFEKMHKSDPAVFDGRLIEIVKKGDAVDVAHLDDIRRLLKAGVNPEQCVDSVGKTMFGVAMRYQSTDMISLLLNYFYAGNPGRMPLVEDKQAIVPYAMRNLYTFLDGPKFDIIFSRGANADEKRECSKIIQSQIANKTFNENMAGKKLRVIAKIIGADMIEQSTLLDLWNAGTVQTSRVFVKPLIGQIVDPRGEVSFDDKITVLQKFAEAGVNFDSPMKDNVLPIGWVMESKCPDVLDAFLTLGCDMDALADSIREMPERFSLHAEEMRAALQSAVARHAMRKISARAISAAANRSIN